MFIKYDYHSLFRSLFCLVISSSSLTISLINWNELIINPIGNNWLSTQINIFMFDYMILDLIYFINNKIFRYELLFHHFVCAIIYFYYNNIVLTFCSSCEIISAFNWITILFPKYEWITKYYRLFSILSLRMWVWLFTINIFKNSSLFYFILSIIQIFIMLDIYWLFIIYKNYIKYSGFINQSIKTKIIKNKNMIRNNLIKKFNKKIL